MTAVAGELPDKAYATYAWPESLIADMDAALSVFEAELHALKSRTDVEILAVVKRLVLALNRINDQHQRAGYAGYETEEREQLCDYITGVLEESGIDVRALEARIGAGPGDIAGSDVTGSRSALRYGSQARPTLRSADLGPQDCRVSGSGFTDHRGSQACSCCDLNRSCRCMSRSRAHPTYVPRGISRPSHS